MAKKEENKNENQIILVGYLKNHSPIYLCLIKFLLSIFKSIDFLTTQEVFSQLKDDLDLNLVNLHIDNRKINRMLLKNKKLINNFKILIMEEYFGGYARTLNLKFKNQKTIMLVHNINKFFLVRKNLYYILDLLFKNRYIEQFQSFIVFSPIVKKYLASFIDNKPVFFFPGEENFSPEANEYHKIEKNIDDPIKIVIPGMITEERREYFKLFNLLKKYYQSYPKSRIQINLLGSINNKENVFQKAKMIKQIEEINEFTENAISYGTGFIPSEKFSQTIQKADLIISNAKVFNKLNDRMEIYGITKITGISYLLYKFEKPALIPTHQNILTGFDNQLIKFDKYEQLIDIFQSLEKNVIDLKEMKIYAYQNRLNFNRLIKNEKKRIKDYLIR